MEWIFVAIIALLQLLDASLTYAIIKNGGREVWKPQKWLQDRLGLLPALVVTKLVMVGTSALAAWYVPVCHPLLVLLYLITMIFAVVCFSNLSVWKNQR